jgi:hypothetical protein
MNAETVTTAPINLFKQLVESKNNTLWNKENLGQVYLMKITHLKGKSKKLYDTFYKLGYSGYQELTSRIIYLPSCYEVEVIDTAIFDRSEARRIEGIIHRHLTTYSYRTKHKKWAGEFECYRLELMERFTSLNQIINNIIHPVVTVNRLQTL